jgi:hypothetical protein
MQTNKSVVYVFIFTILSAGFYLNTAAGTVITNADWVSAGQANGDGLCGNIEALALDSSGKLYAGSYDSARCHDRNVLLKSDSGWTVFGGGVGGAGVYTIASDINENIYVGGPFTIPDVADHGFVYMNGDQWSGMGLLVGKVIKTIATDGHGNAFVGGQFDPGKDADWGNLALMSCYIWSPLKNGFNGEVTALAVNSTGTLYAGGMFDSASGVAAASIARWDGMDWIPLGKGLHNGQDRAYISVIAFDKNDNLYVGGDFTIAGDQPAAFIAKWDTAAMTWSPLGKGIHARKDYIAEQGEIVKSLVFDNNDNLYAGGLFDTAGEAAAENIARWDGTAWSPLGSGCNDKVRGMVIDKNGILHVAGWFDTAGGVFSPYYATCKVAVQPQRITMKHLDAQAENGCIRIRLSKATDVYRRVISLSGKELLRSHDVMPAGDHAFDIKTTGVARGVYLFYVKYSNESKMRRLIIH